ncbi:MAG: 3-dehydroquinate synthase [Planctomycetota bacterium]|nr:MAG: 3-dehydroquinate synthase [Planctomycetota bacterium]
MDTPHPSTLTVQLPGRSYPIHFPDAGLAAAGALIAEALPDADRCLVVADARVAELHGESLTRSLKAAGLGYHLATFAPGETSKTLETAEQLWQAAAAMRLDRRGLVVALGGGVCGDLAGFVAACWMRGVRMVQIPTTLLAMVDSSVGGKTGVNSAAGKNLIGAFHQPSLVIMDTTILASMEQREYAAGLAEVVKYGVIEDADFFAWQEAQAAALVARDPQVVAQAVYRSCAIKAAHVEADEFEQGIRAHLNYGHTFGHALEGSTAYRRYLHGEAVAIGMNMAAAAAEALGFCADKHLLPRQEALLRALGLPLVHRLGPDPAGELADLAARTALDKKVSAGRQRFVLPRCLGEVAVVTDPDPTAIAAGFAAYASTEASALTGDS